MHWNRLREQGWVLGYQNIRPSNGAKYGGPGWNLLYERKEISLFLPLSFVRAKIFRSSLQPHRIKSKIFTSYDRNLFVVLPPPRRRINKYLHGRKGKNLGPLTPLPRESRDQRSGNLRDNFSPRAILLWHVRAECRATEQEVILRGETSRKNFFIKATVFEKIEFESLSAILEFN